MSTSVHYIWMTDADEKVSPPEMPVLGVCAVGGLTFLKVATYTEDGVTNSYVKIVEVSVPTLELVRAIALAAPDVVREGDLLAKLLVLEDDDRERLKDEMSTMHRTVVHQCCEDAQQLRQTVEDIEARNMVLADMNRGLHDEVAKWKALAEQAESALRAVRADKPSAHTDDVWAMVQDAIHAFDARKEATRD